MKKILTLFVLVAISAISFGGPQNYEIKSGEIVYEIATEMFGMENTISSTLYFDDYGKKEASRTISSGQLIGIDGDMDITTITSENSTYVINNTTKEYSVLSMEESEDYDSNLVDDFDLDEYQKSGKEKILGKNCDILTFEGEDEDGKVSNKIWMWKGLILKMDMSIEMEGFVVSTKMTATKIKTGNIDNSIFKIPSDYSEISYEF